MLADYRNFFTRIENLEKKVRKADVKMSGHLKMFGKMVFSRDYSISDITEISRDANNTYKDLLKDFRVLKKEYIKATNKFRKSLKRHIEVLKKSEKHNSQEEAIKAAKEISSAYGDYYECYNKFSEMLREYSVVTGLFKAFSEIIDGMSEGATISEEEFKRVKKEMESSVGRYIW